MQRPTDDRYLMTRDELQARMAVLLGGRAAEQVVFGHLSTGAADDLARATSIARSMVMRYAMVPELGPISYEEDRDAPLGSPALLTRPHSDETAREIDKAVRFLVQQAFDRARGILEANRDLLRESARALLAQETLDDDALAPLFARIEVPADEPARPAAGPHALPRERAS
jgi:cell division protease FtsH